MSAFSKPPDPTPIAEDLAVLCFEALRGNWTDDRVIAAIERGIRDRQRQLASRPAFHVIPGGIGA
jgi:hypothetical protein